MLLCAVSVVIQFSLPASYPDEIPEVTVTTGTGLEVQQMRELERNITEQVSRGSILISAHLRDELVL